MTAQYYVTEFNKSLYDKEVMAQIFFIPSEALLVRPNETLHSGTHKKKTLYGCLSALPQHTLQTLVLVFIIHMSIEWNSGSEKLWKSFGAKKQT